MQLGEIITSFSEEAPANEALLACNDIVLFARVGEAAGRYDETVGEYAAGAVRRFANLAVSEDWLGLMNLIERAEDPGHRLPDLHGQLVAEAGRSAGGAALTGAPATATVAAREYQLTGKVVRTSRALARVGILVISDRASRGEYGTRAAKRSTTS